MINDTPRRIHSLIFWIGIVLTTLLVASGFFVERCFQYSIEKQNRIKFGSFGFYLAKQQPALNSTSPRRVVLLGNSVYQYSFIPKLIQGFADQDSLDLKILNMAQISSSLYDYLLQTAKLSNERIHLLVISMNVGSFSLDPKFKTDADQFAFDPDVLKVLPFSFYQNTFDYKTAADLALSTVLPIKRVDPILRWKLKLRDHLPESFLKWFSYPYLNIPQSQQVQKTVQMTTFESSSEDRQRYVLGALLSILERQHIPTLIIWQEQACDPANPQLALLKKMTQLYPQIQVVDLSPFWNREHFVDSIHPTGEEEEAYARRHFNIICQTLKNYGL